MSKEQWIRELFESVDNLEAEKFVSFMTEDATFKLGNAEAMTGKTAIG